MIEDRDYRTLRFNSDLGKHGDTGTSEVEVVARRPRRASRRRCNRQPLLEYGSQRAPGARRQSS